MTLEKEPIKLQVEYLLTILLSKLNPVCTITYCNNMCKKYQPQYNKKS